MSNPNISLSRRYMMSTALAATAAAFVAAPAEAQLRLRGRGTAAPSAKKVRETMLRATKYMVEDVSNNGGYVWAYLPDMSRRWGEMEAYPTMVWIQPPGTPTMGLLFLDAYNATGDEYYYQAAEKTARALIWGQLDCGGWNYFFDFAGEQSLKQWYKTIGKNAWRLEEFQHYWGNATFDDEGTYEALVFLLRLYMQKKDPTYRPALEKGIDFVLASQYANGGWPQRFPLKFDGGKHGKPDYTSFITFNDGVSSNNMEFLIMCYQALGDERVLDHIQRGMNVYLLAQNPDPQPGWALQYTPDLKPCGARSYEPDALTTHTTYSTARELINFYRLTGDTRYLYPIPRALDWLESLRLPDQDGRTNLYPTFIELGTNKPLYNHRRGSNITNGEYYADYNPANPIRHYGQMRVLDVPKLRAEYEKAKATPPAEASKDSPLLHPSKPLKKFFLSEPMSGTSDLNATGGPGKTPDIVAGLNKEGYWPTPLKATSNPYIGPAPKEVAAGDFGGTHVGDAYDTSPYTTSTPVDGISLTTYIENMKALIKAL